MSQVNNKNKYGLLTEFLSTQDKFKNLKIGSKDGSSFWYCGTVLDFMENIKEYSAVLKSNAKMLADRAEANVKIMRDNPLTITKWIEDELRAYKKTGVVPDISYENYIVSQNKWFKRLSSRVNSMVLNDNKVKNFIPLLSRKIESVNKAYDVVDENCIIIVVEGYEQGKYWKLEEAKDQHIGLSNNITENSDSDISEEDIEEVA